MQTIQGRGEEFYIEEVFNVGFDRWKTWWLETFCIEEQYFQKLVMHIHHVECVQVDWSQ